LPFTNRGSDELVAGSELIAAASLIAAVKLMQIAGVTVMQLLPASCFRLPNAVTGPICRPVAICFPAGWQLVPSAIFLD